MKRFAHKLKANKSMAFPRHMIFFDTETYTSKQTEQGKEQTMKLYSVCYFRRASGRHPNQHVWSYGVSDKDLALFILSKCRDRTCLYIFSANIWFDIRVSNFLKLLIAADFKIKTCFHNGKCFLMKCLRGKQSIRFINIQNIFPVTVKAIGEVIGLPKLDVDFDTAPDDKLLEYCRRDTEIILEAIKYWFRFVQEHNLGCFGMTLASQAFNAYRHRFMKIPIMIHDNAKVLAHERTGYYGGRTECFFIGEIKGKTTYVLDINSQYPYVMQSFDYPHALRYQSDDTTPDEVYKLSGHYAVVAACALDTDLPAYPKKLDGKTVFPIGRFYTCLCTPSFRFAYEHGHVSDVKFVSVYQKGKIFEKWVIEMYALRQRYMREKNKSMTYMVKILLNSLYGKFGQRSDEVLEEGSRTEEDYYTEPYYSNTEKIWYNIIQIGNYYKVVKAKANEAFHSFPTISAHVTDYARMYLWHLMCEAGRENVLYVDTDSLYTNAIGYKRLTPYIDEMELGKLKLEQKERYFRIYAPKDYVIGKKRVLKGIPKNAIKLGKNRYECDVFPGMKRDLQTGMSDHYVIERRIKELKRIYDKGVIDPNGWVSPFRLQEF